jgi:hypothetical protein
MGENGQARIEQVFSNQREVWSGRGDLNARPPAPKECEFSSTDVHGVLLSGV